MTHVVTLTKPQVAAIYEKLQAESLDAIVRIEQDDSDAVAWSVYVVEDMSDKSSRI